MQQLEVISSHQLLIEFSGGAEPPKEDLKMIEEVMVNQKLSQGVINVLIYYVMLRTDMKLSRRYFEKIAGHWARKKVHTVQEAMNLVKTEDKQYQYWQKTKNNHNSNKKIDNSIYQRELYKRSIERRYGFDKAIINLILDYTDDINDGLFPKWFVISLSDFLQKHDLKEFIEAEQLIRDFHKKYVLNFGK